MRSGDRVGATRRRLLPARRALEDGSGGAAAVLKRLARSYRQARRRPSFPGSAQAGAASVGAGLPSSRDGQGGGIAELGNTAAGPASTSAPAPYCRARPTSIAVIGRSRQGYGQLTPQTWRSSVGMWNGRR